MYAFVMFGADQTESIALRDRLRAALGGDVPRETLGQAHGVAWLTRPTPQATAADLAAGRTVFLSCLS